MTRRLDGVASVTDRHLCTDEPSGPAARRGAPHLMLPRAPVIAQTRFRREIFGRMNLWQAQVSDPKSQPTVTALESRPLRPCSGGDFFFHLPADGFQPARIDEMLIEGVPSRKGR